MHVSMGLCMCVCMYEFSVHCDGCIACSAECGVWQRRQQDVLRPAAHTRLLPAAHQDEYRDHRRLQRGSVTTTYITFVNTYIHTYIHTFVYA